MKKAIKKEITYGKRESFKEKKKSVRRSIYFKKEKKKGIIQIKR